MATELMAMVAITGLMAMEDTTTERGLLRPSPLPMLLLMPLLRLIPGTEPMADMAMADMVMVAITGLMVMEDTTTERGLLRPSPLPMLLLMPLPRLIPGTAMAMAMASTDLTAMDTMGTGLMAMDTTERGLLKLSPLLMLLPLLPLMLMLMLMPGTDTMAMAAELMAMVA